MWASEVHGVFKAEDNVDNQLINFEEKCFVELNELAGMVRGELPPLSRSTLCALITIDVHARDIVSTMVANKVRTR
jgi:dynein heavy chain